jgi:hypothetical protein
VESRIHGTESGIQREDSGIEEVESGIQEVHGLPYMGREAFVIVVLTCGTAFLKIYESLNHSHYLRKL